MLPLKVINLYGAPGMGKSAVAAGLLWYGRLNGTIRGVTSETVVLLLSAFAGFSSIFAWMLFSPNRRSETESSALFFGGALTLLPPCIIAFCLMPSDSLSDLAGNRP